MTMDLKISNSKDVVRLLDTTLSDLLDEQLTVITVNSCNKVIAIHNEVTKGTSSFVPLSTKQIARLAVMDYASGVIIVHNHPSGDPFPSTADIKETKRLRNALKELEVNLHDHIIIGDKTYYSFSDEEIHNKN